MKKHCLLRVYNEQLKRAAFGEAWFLFLHIKATSTFVNETPSGSSQRGRLIKLIRCKITLETQVDANFVWHFRNLTDGHLCVFMDVAPNSSAYLLQTERDKWERVKVSAYFTMMNA